MCRKMISRSNNLAVLLAFFALLASCARKQQDAAEMASIGTPVEVVHPRIQNFTEYIDLNANTIFMKKEVVRATFAGFIHNIYKSIGDQVGSGDLVFTIKTKEAAADDSIWIDIGSAQFQGSIPIRAHSHGVLTALNFHTGDFVSEGEEIAVIANPSSLRIELNVPFPYVSRIAPGSACEIFLPDGRKVSAIVQKIIPSVDPASQTQLFLLRLEPPVALPENLNVNARLPLRTVQNAVVLPRGAVLSNETQDSFWVMRIIGGSTAERVDVQKGIESDSLIQIVQPILHPSDQIVSEGAYGLPDSARVTITQQQ
jgi:multidrug efflux pump subunit AcrA (membrane-fusion protein)